MNWAGPSSLLPPEINSGQRMTKVWAALQERRSLLPARTHLGRSSAAMVRSRLHPPALASTVPEGGEPGEPGVGLSSTRPSSLCRARCRAAPSVLSRFSLAARSLVMLSFRSSGSSKECMAMGGVGWLAAGTCGRTAAVLRPGCSRAAGGCLPRLQDAPSGLASSHHGKRAPATHPEVPHPLLSL